MPFPFVAPFKKEISDKLTDRELRGLDIHKLSPFAILSSGAVVTNKSENILSTIKNGTYDDSAYKGCVISNQTSFGLMYQTAETILGFDLNGKQIKIDGESGRKISTPIIQSIEIDTDGGNNTLKSARVKVKVFSLKQLEMFDLFFLRPSMPVVLEYGWNTDLIGKTTIDTHLISKKNHHDFCTEVANHFSKFKESKIDYLETLKTTKYNFDYMVGKVTDFTYSPDEDGTYNVDLEISAGNELQLWMPMKQSTGKASQSKKDPKAAPYQMWLNKIYADFNLPQLIEEKQYSEKKWKDEFFNWGMINQQEKDKTVSYKQYISFKFALELLSLSEIFKLNDEKIIYYYEDKAKTNPIIPMNSHKFMCSTSEDLIIPNSIPAFKRNNEKGKENELILDVNGPLQECSVNNKKFNIKAKEIFDNDGNLYKLADNLEYGNLLNVFLSYDAVLMAYNQSFSQADFINNILAIVNDNTFGLCKLELMSQTDDVTKGSKSLTIIDYKLTVLGKKEPSKDSYTFKIGPDSILREFSFNMELSTLAQAQAMYQSQLNYDKIIKGEELDNSVNAQLKNEAYKLFDLSYARNSDGYFSINEIDKLVVIEAAKYNKEKIKNTNLDTSKPKADDSDKQPEDLAELIKQKSVKFKTILNTQSKIKTYIFLDKGVIQQQIKKEEEGSALTYLDISLAIDGLSGLSCGEYFNIQGIPEIYNRNGYFQITNVKQGIDESGWKTTIEAGYRIDVKKAFGK